MFEVKGRHSNYLTYLDGFCSLYAFKEPRLKIYCSIVKKSFKSGSMRPLNLIMITKDLLLSK